MKFKKCSMADENLFFLNDNQKICCKFLNDIFYYVKREWDNLALTVYRRVVYINLYIYTHQSSLTYNL